MQLSSLARNKVFAYTNNVQVTFPWFLVIFLILLTLQIISARQIQINFFQLLRYLTRSRRAAIVILSIIFLPGTLIHELSHVLLAKALFVHTGAIDILPSFETEEEQVKMGSAEIGRTDPVRRSLIGLSPIIFGTTLIIVLIWLFGDRLDFRQTSFVWWQALTLIYTVFVIGNTFVSSDKDLEGIKGVIVTLISVLVIVGLFLFFTDQLTSANLTNIYARIYPPPVDQFFARICFALGVPLIVNLTFLGLFRLLRR